MAMEIFDLELRPILRLNLTMQAALKRYVISRYLGKYFKVCHSSRIFEILGAIHLQASSQAEAD